MEELEHLEAELAEFEHLTGQPLTILGLDGIFDFRQVRRLFTPLRASHKKVGACAAIFSEHCIEHCRHRQTRRCREAAGPFASECPFGIRQLVFPLRMGPVHYGMFFLGAWRSEAVSETKLPEPFRDEYAKLPPANPAEEAVLLLLGELCADGVLHRLLTRGLLTDTPDFRSARIRDFLQSRLAGRVGLPDLAQELELSSSHTSALVKKLLLHHAASTHAGGDGGPLPRRNRTQTAPDRRTLRLLQRIPSEPGVQAADRPRTERLAEAMKQLSGRRIREDCRGLR